MRENHSTEHPSLTKKADAGLSSRRHRTNKDFNVYPRQVDILPGVKRPVGPASCRIVIQFADCQESHRSAFFHRYIVRVYSWTQDSAKHSTSTCSSMFFRVESLQRNNLHQLKTTTLSLLLAFRLSSVHHYREAKHFFFHLLPARPFLGRPYLGTVGCAPFGHPCRQHEIKTDEFLHLRSFSDQPFCQITPRFSFWNSIYFT